MFFNLEEFDISNLFFFFKGKFDIRPNYYYYFLMIQ